VVSDIDGTITKSNARGVIDTILTENYRHCHPGVCDLLSRLATSHSQPTHKTHILYLTSRPIGLASHTRKFLNGLRQGSAQLPPGPVLGFPGTLPEVLFMELVSKKTQKFKAELLLSQIVEPFQNASRRSPFLAGLGNSWMDVQAYHMIGIDLPRIYMIDKKSNITVFDKGPSEAIRPTHAYPRKWYVNRIGNTFQGYLDESFVLHVTGELKPLQVV